MSKLDKQLIRLMAEHWYYVKDGAIYSKPLVGYPAQFVSRCRDVFDAAEQLCPIIKDPQYTERLSKLTSGL